MTDNDLNQYKLLRFFQEEYNIVITIYKTFAMSNSYNYCILMEDDYDNMIIQESVVGRTYDVALNDAIMYVTQTNKNFNTNVIVTNIDKYEIKKQVNFKLNEFKTKLVNVMFNYKHDSYHKIFNGDYNEGRDSIVKSEIYGIVLKMLEKEQLMEVPWCNDNIDERKKKHIVKLLNELIEKPNDSFLRHLCGRMETNSLFSFLYKLLSKAQEY